MSGVVSEWRKDDEFVAWYAEFRRLERWEVIDPMYDEPETYRCWVAAQTKLVQDAGGMALANHLLNEHVAELEARLAIHECVEHPHPDQKFDECKECHSFGPPIGY